MSVWNCLPLKLDNAPYLNSPEIQICDDVTSSDEYNGICFITHIYLFTLMRKTIQKVNKFSSLFTKNRTTNFCPKKTYRKVLFHDHTQENLICKICRNFTTTTTPLKYEILHLSAKY